MASSEILERIHPVHGAGSAEVAACEDIFNGNITSDVIDMSEADKAVLIIVTCANAGGSAIVTVNACDDTTPTNTTAISFRVQQIESRDTRRPISTLAAFTTSTAANILYFIEVDADDLGRVSSFDARYVEFVMTENDNAAVDGAVTMFLTGLRSAEAQKATQVD